ncbi:MAG: sigma-70 family RNA polymerase sigma factor [bacterium]|nr:sigma-70 family RNA polymerase sigma factor [bacterium]
MALNRAKFNQWVDDFGPALYRLAYRSMGDRHEAEDAVQEAFRSAWDGRHNYQEGHSDRGWLTAILRRRIADRYRRKPQPRVLASDDGIEPSIEPTDPFRDQYSDEMQHALNALSTELRETLLLVVVGELTHQEAADLLEIPLGTVLSRVSRARKKLREQLLALQ